MASRRTLKERFAVASHTVRPRLRRRPVLEVLEGRALLATFTVNSFGDAGNGSNNAGDLRYCINQANANDQANTIVFDSTLFSAPQTMDLSDGPLELSDTGGTQTFTGPAAELTISAGEANIFQVDPGVTASISGLTIAGGFETNDGGALANDGTTTLTDCTLSSNSDGIGGGVFDSATGNLTMTDCTVSGLISSGVFNLGIANLTDCTLSGNYGYKEGGGVYNLGTATVTNCSINGNYALVGGGVFNSATGNVTLTGCTISDNSCVSGNAGGVFNSGTATLTDCTISGNESGGIAGGVSNSGNLTLTNCNVSGNTAYRCGGVFNSGTGSVTNCTISGNNSYYGGGVSNYGTVNLTACTITGNSGLGGGVENESSYGYPDSGIATLTDTIVANNAGASASASDITGSGNVSGSYNLIGTGGSGGLTDGVDGNIVLTSLDVLGLTALGNFGGPTQTMALLPGSIGLGAGTIADYTGTTTPITTDQRGEPLDVPNPDIGAFQSQGFTLTVAAGSTGQSTAIGTAFANPLVVTVVANNEVEPVDGGVLTFTAPAAGASATLSATTVTIGLNFNGVVSVTAAANSSAGSYTVNASVGGDTAPVDFGLTNTTGSNNNGSLTTFTVNSLGDALSGSGDSGDLRYCINEANADDGPNQIVFDPTVFSTPQTITLSLGQLELSDTGGTQTITGPAAGVTISGGRNSRVFQIDDGVTASISGVTISDGAIGYPGSGAGLANYGTTTLTGCNVSGNYAYIDVAGAAGVFNSAAANLTMTDCTLSGNYGTGTGGLANNGTANLIDCTLSGNFGSGLLNYGTVNLTGSNVSGNSTKYAGGGVSNSGTANLTDCTVSGNSAAVGGGLNNYGTANLTGCTLSGNSASLEGGGLTSYGGSSPAGPANLVDTIVAGNTDTSGASDIGGSDVSGSNNLIGTGGSGGLANGVDGNIVLTSLTDLGLAPLGNNGGPTQTMALLPGSPAIGAGVIADYPGTTTPITTDQRGEPLDSPNPDIGAYQTQGSTLTSLNFSGISNQSITYGTSSVTVSGTLANGSQAPVGETVAVTLDSVQQSATIGSGGAFSTTFDTTGLTVANSPNTITYAYVSDGTFSSASTTSTLTVNPATLTITANPETKDYGANDPALAYTAGGFQFNDTAGSVLTGALTRAQSGTLAGEQAGGYAITQGTLAADSNYTIAFTGSTLRITPAPLTVTANPQTKVYGTADPTLTDSATGFVDATVDSVTIDDTAATALTGDLARAPGETVSGGPFAITQGTLASSNYKITFTAGALTISPKPLTVTANTQTKVYGTTDSTLTDTATGFVDATVDGVTIDDTAATALTGHLARTAGETVSGGPYAITQGTLASSNYKITFTGSTLAITPAPLIVTANTQTKVYGTADPGLTDTATGFIDATVDGVTIDDTATAALTGHLARTSGETVSGSPYAITQGTLASSNYKITFTGSTLTITPAPLTVAANLQTKVYGTADPALTETATGFVNTTVDGVTIDDTAATALTGQLARTPGETVSGGPYAITQGTLAASNYKITFAGSALTITPAPLTVTANPQTKVYGTADPTLTDTATGFIDTTVDGVTIDDTATTALTGDLSRTPGETVSGGPYTITQGTLAASNYKITFTGSTLAITPATLAIAAEPETKVFGSADPKFAYTASGFQFSDTAATVLSGSPAGLAGETVTGSPYAIGQGTLAASSNYAIQFTGSTLTVTPATPKVTVSDPSGTYTSAPIAAMATIAGVGGSAMPNLEGIKPTLAYYTGSGTSGMDLGSAAPSAAGTYTVVARFPGSADYAAAQSTPVTFVIAPAAATITLTSQSSSPVFGQAVTFVATVDSAGSAPGGTVTFADGTTPLATVPLDGSGQAALTISTLSLGSHAITVTYNGGTDIISVKSSAMAESISPAATTIVLVPHAVLKGKKTLKAVELTAEIEPVAPGGGFPTGRVTFELLTKQGKKTKVKTLGTAGLSGGEATLSFKPNAVLNQKLTVIYSGDPNFLASMISPPRLTKAGIARSRI